MEGYKHLIECHCVLPQFRNATNPPWHKFVVFSTIDDGDTVVPKHAKCNNCGVVHNVFDIGKSEILSGQEIGAVMDIDDVKIMMPDSLSRMLTTYSCDIATWENVLFVLQHNKFPSSIVLDRNEESGVISGKILDMKDYAVYSIRPYSGKVET